MRVLLDENLPRRLKQCFAEGVEVLTVQDCGWKGLQDGELLRIAQTEFDVFVTTDKGIPFEQNLSSLSIAIVLLETRSNRFEDLVELLPQLNEIMQSINIGDLVRISH